MTRRRPLVGLLLLAGALCVAPWGCASPEKRTVRDDTAGDFEEGDQPAPPEEIQSQVQSFADNFLARWSSACYEVERQISDPERRLRIDSVKAATGHSIVSIAASPNPWAALLDMYVLARLTLHATENYWTEDEQFGAAGVPLVEAATWADRTMRTIVREYLTEEQRTELEDLVAAWKRENPDVYSVSHVRLRDFADFRFVTDASDVEASGSVLSLLLLDPFAKLDPATREIRESRHVAERMLFLLERMPFLLVWDIDVLSGELMAEPEIASSLRNADRVTEAADRFAGASESFAETAAGLRDDLPRERQAFVDSVAQATEAERQAAIEQIDAVFRERTEQFIEQAQAATAAERAAFFDRLQDEQAELRGLALEVRTTLESGRDLAESVATAAGAIDTLTANLRQGADPDAEGFSMRELGEAMKQTQLAAAEINLLLDSTEALLNSPATADQAAIEELIARTQTGTDRLVSRMFIAGVGLIGLGLIAALLYRFASIRWLRA